MKHWRVTTKFDEAACALADVHYSRERPGSGQFMPPGQTIVLTLKDGAAVFGWRRPHPDRRITEANGFYGWTCTIFRNESPILSSELILDAEQAFAEFGYDAGELRTYVNQLRVRSFNPGYCFKCAGWKKIGESKMAKLLLLGKTISVRAAQERMFA